MPKPTSKPKPKPTSKSSPKPKSKPPPREPTTNSTSSPASAPAAPPQSTTSDTNQPDPFTDQPDPFPALHNKPLRMRYRIARGEQGVLTFEPYKSALLPHWRFKDPPAARASATALRARFKRYADARDFVGMDMARKFLQMGVTRARRYANYAGGRKYDAATGAQLVKGREFKGRADKLEASEIFRAELEWCRARPVYAECREEFLSEQRQWDLEQAGGGVEVDARTGQVAADRGVEGSGEAGESTGPRRSTRRK